MKTYKVGMVGFGWVSTAHLTTFKELPNFEPVAIMSRRELDPGQIKADYGAEVKVYNDYDKFLNDPDIDIVDICTCLLYTSDAADDTPCVDLGGSAHTAP